MHRTVLGLLIVFALAAMPPAWAQGPGQYSKVALIGVGQSQDREGLWAALVFEIAPGWKTYWRNPGDAGIAPRLDWAGSVNLQDVELFWPAPRRFFDGYAHSIGYKGPKVVLPVRIVPERADRPVALSLLIDYAVCERVCIPERAELSGFVRPKPAPSKEASLLLDAFAALPKSDAVPGLPTIDSVERDGEGKHIIVTLKDADRPGLDLFAEGPNGEPLLVPTRGEPAGPVSFSVPLQGVAPAVQGGNSDFRFTLVWDGGAVERKAPVR